MGVIKKIDKVYQNLNWSMRKAARKASVKKFMKSHIESGTVLTEKQKKSIEKFWAPYCKVNFDSYLYYTQKFGEFHPEFIPNDIHQNYIDRYYNDAKRAVVLENKCFFRKMFPTVLQPDTVVYRMNGFWYNSDDEIITFEEAKSIISKEETIITKQAVGSFGGLAVTFIDQNNGRITEDFVNTVKKIREDIIVQRPVRQHPELAKLNDSSVNSIRVVSLLHKDGTVKVYSCVLRMGINGMRVDNESSGGVNCGIQENGFLREIGHTKSEGGLYKKHPSSGIVFAGYQIPNFKDVVEEVKSIHKLIPHFRLVSWDFAVNEDGRPVLIEANLNCGGININQVNNGPIFGKDTKMILDEVFGKK